MHGILEQERSFEHLYRRHRRAVYTYVLRDLRNPDDAEDVTQTAFLNAFRALRAGNAPERPRAWLLTIARNVCRRRFRLGARHPQELELDPELTAAQAPYDGPGATEIVAALERLPPNQREAILLREFEGRSYAEIARRLALSVSAVETLLFRARRRLREELETADTPPRRERSLLCLPLPAALASALDWTALTLGRTGLGARAAGLAAAAVIGAGATVGLGLLPSDVGAEKPVRPVAKEPAPAARVAVVASDDLLIPRAGAAGEPNGGALVSGERPAADATEPRTGGGLLPVPLPEVEAPELGLVPLPAVRAPDLGGAPSVPEAALPATPKLPQVQAPALP